MASFIWQRDPDEAYHNPYEHEAQEQFLREAESVLEGIRPFLNQYDMTFHKDDESVKKAVWLLQTDALCSLYDALAALKEKRHRLVSRVFRDIVETLDLAKLFSVRSDKSGKLLAKWYKNEIISHGEYRKLVESMQGPEVAGEIRQQYRNLSKFTHRTYRSITASCGLGRDDLMWHENHSPDLTSMLPQPVAAYCAVFASFVLTFCSEVAARGLVEEDKVKDVFSSSMEAEPVKRRFMITGKWRYSDGG